MNVQPISVHPLCSMYAGRIVRVDYAMICAHHFVTLTACQAMDGVVVRSTFVATSGPGPTARRTRSVQLFMALARMGWAFVAHCVAVGRRKRSAYCWRILLIWRDYLSGFCSELVQLVSAVFLRGSNLASGNVLSTFPQLRVERVAGRVDSYALRILCVVAAFDSRWSCNYERFGCSQAHSPALGFARLSRLMAGSSIKMRMCNICLRATAPACMIIVG